MNSKKGSSSVFLMVILGALVSIALLLIYSVRDYSVASRADGVINLAGDSLMSEFDYYVQKEYGLFILSGSDSQLTRKLRSYVGYSLDDMEDVKVEDVNVSGSRFSVVNKELIEEQIIEHMKLTEAEGLLKAAVGGDKKEENMMEERSLRDGPTVVSLPSGMVPGKKLTTLAAEIAESVTDAEEAFREGTEKYLMNCYIMMYFNNRTRQNDAEHFFRNEAEYILAGELSDRKNEKRVEIALKAMRFPLNLAHIYSDSEKNAATMAMAQMMTPGAGAAATQAALAATWAYAEADNDVELLMQGNKVPLIKDKTTWAIDLNSAVEGIFGGTVRPAMEKGYDYEKYLQIMLFFQDENIRTARILDLIQINCRKNYNRNFIIQEYSSGVTIEARVNGKRFRYEKQY
ncbi:MAG: DUF5702 domain-containing protein [Bacillota bacterium]|nr:DUF5702 domain-containing protein [Bacillota bacterium]